MFAFTVILVYCILMDAQDYLVRKRDKLCESIIEEYSTFNFSIVVNPSDFWTYFAKLDVFFKSIYPF